MMTTEYPRLRISTGRRGNQRRAEGQRVACAGPQRGHRRAGAGADPGWGAALL